MSSNEESKINFFTKKTNPKLTNRKKLKAFLETIFSQEETEPLAINIIFCNDEHLLSINRQYLNHDFLTDIITFDLSDNSDGLIADIFISVDRVVENSKNLRVDYKLEIHRVIFHGVLHLCGYKDKKKKDQKLMRQKEDLYLRKYFQ